MNRTVSTPGDDSVAIASAARRRERRHEFMAADRPRRKK
jgi:hypothetical protein